MRSSSAAAVALVTLATFTDLVAYSVAVPVLPDLARRFGASATTIGLLFGSFGVTLLAVSAPAGAISDRLGRRLPLVAGSLALAGATIVFGLAESLPLLFVARMIQGAADGVTWVVGFALIADLYGSDERGRMMGYVMSGASVGIIVGPSAGGWLYEAGGVQAPFVFTTLLAIACAVGFLLLRVPPAAPRPRTSIWQVLRVGPVARCAATVVVISATVAMLEPVLPMFFSRNLGMKPTEIGFLFGAAAVTSAVLPFLFGPMTDRFGGDRLTRIGLVATALWMPMMATATGFGTALAIIAVQWTAIALMITPSLAYMADVTAFAGRDAFGIGYGLFNTAWGIGLLVGPSLGGWLLERLGFVPLTIGWSIATLVSALMLWRVKSKVSRARMGPGVQEPP